MNTSFITKAGILTALGVILTYLSILLPTNKLFTLGLTSCLIPITIVLTNVRTGILVYIATSLLNLLLIGLRGQVFLYILFFGSYGLIKLYIEKIRNLYLEIILKFSFFNICLVISYFIYKFFLPDNIINLPFKFIISGWLVFQLGFFLQDYALTIIIHIINTRFKINKNL
ncbi:hypothetical protein BD780_004090 [Clostridium tetanomorphum]|nr:hypothetical protein CTM_18326 [Clostridium tetanomorphum DSM 665]MBP1865743.1 hypothetical protein [Clostridium tetanomorphum]NRS86865.1 hypothetical protein [Clostridium tetanomorphum]NRZ99379.1 hypothetical protein [Clostridium tetanomorphum]SQC00334.1 membrane protein [Clostridium tetanomorphum]